MDHIGGKLEAVISRLEALGRRTQNEARSSVSENVLLFPGTSRTSLEVPSIAKGRGWTEEQEQDYAHRAARLQELQGQSGVPERYQRFTWETWRGQPGADFLAWPTKTGPDGRVPWAVIAFGPRGAGKTHATTAVFSDLLCRGWICRWFEVAEALEEVKAEFDDKVYEGRTMKALRETPILLLDDLGAERLTEFSADRIAHVLRYRYNRELFTIISTNLTLEELDAIDPRLGSRLGGREALQLNFAGRKDWRL